MYTNMAYIPSESKRVKFFDFFKLSKIAPSPEMNLLSLTPVQA